MPASPKVKIRQFKGSMSWSKIEYTPMCWGQPEFLNTHWWNFTKIRDSEIRNTANTVYIYSLISCVAYYTLIKSNLRSGLHYPHFPNHTSWDRPTVIFVGESQKAMVQAHAFSQKSSDMSGQNLKFNPCNLDNLEESKVEVHQFLAMM